MSEQISWPARLGPPVDARPLFGPERAALLCLLGGLDHLDWTRPTVCPGWTVADVAAHLIGDDLSRLGRSRDGHQGLSAGAGEDFPAFLHRINGEWVTAARRLSPALTSGLLAWTGEQIVEYWAGQEMSRIGGPVSWAGPEPAPVWLDAARDFTEYWLHRHQILDALGLPGDSTPGPRYFLYDTLVRGLPFALREVPAGEGAEVAVTVTGPGGGSWAARRDGGEWSLSRDPGPSPDTHVTLDGDTAWQLWSGAIDPRTARGRLTIDGDTKLGHAVLRMVSVIQ